MGRVPSIKEIAIALGAGASVVEVAERAGCTPRSVRYVARRGGLTLPQARRRSERRQRLADRKWLRRQLLVDGKSPTVIARELGGDLADVRAAVEAASFAWTARRPHSHPGLSDREWLARQLGARRSLQAIADEIGCSVSAVRQAAVRHGIDDRRRIGEFSFPQLHDPVWLRRRYLGDRQSSGAIASQLGCQPGTVLRALHRAGVPVRAPGGAHRRIAELHDPVWLQRRYVGDGRSGGELARELGCRPGSVLRALHRAGVPVRAPGGGGRRIIELQDAMWLRRRYVDDRRSAREIAEELDCSPRVVMIALRSAGIEPHAARAFPQLRSRAWLTQRYVTEGATTGQIAEQVGCGRATVRRALDKAGIALRRVQRRRPPPARRLHVQWQRSGTIAGVAGANEVSGRVAEVWLAEVGIFSPRSKTLDPAALAAASGSGASIGAIARQLGTSSHRVRIEMLRHRQGSGEAS